VDKSCDARLKKNLTPRSRTNLLDSERENHLTKKQGMAVWSDPSFQTTLSNFSDTF
jgi:hypothetical protein